MLCIFRSSINKINFVHTLYVQCYFKCKMNSSSKVFPMPYVFSQVKLPSCPLCPAPMFFLLWNRLSSLDYWYLNNNQIGCSENKAHNSDKEWWLVWWQLYNSLVLQFKFNRFLHLDEPPRRIFCYLIRHFDWGLSKVGHFQFSDSNLEAKIQLDLPENDFPIKIPH